MAEEGASLSDLSDEQLAALARQAGVPAPAGFGATPKPPDNRNSIVRAGDRFSAALQGARDEERGPALGEIWQGELGPEYRTGEGKFVLVDPKRHVVLADPTTGKP